MASSVELFTPQFHKVVDNIIGSEGPVFTPNGQFYCVAVNKEVDGKAAGEIVRVDLKNKSKTLLCAPNFVNHGGQPCGLASDKENNLWVADMVHGILKVTPDGQVTQIARVDDKGDSLQGCNDCIFDYDGNLWVTAPAGNIAPEELRFSFEEPFGSVYCLTKDGIVTKIDSGFQFSNGIAVQHDDKGKPTKLIVAETPTRSLWSYDILGPGKVTNKRLWGKVTVINEYEDERYLFNGPDGMDFDEVGNLLVTNWHTSHIDVFGPDGGQCHSRVKCPFTKPTNVHFKPASNICYVTEHSTNSLWWFEWKYKGRTEYCDL